MGRPQLPDHIVQLNARLKADPQLTEQMGPVHLLSVPGRVTGELRTTPVSPLDFDHRRWLVGGWENADWVKNLRASGWGLLTKGQRVERIRVVEVPMEQRAPVLRAFVQERSGGRFAFDLSLDAPLEAFAAAAERYPVFEIVAAEPPGAG
jgi:deazaflavin-dependent oxidoreductase (nitroreductase family)